MSISAQEQNRVATVDWQETDLYRFFALVFGPPTRQCFNVLSQLSLQTSLPDLWTCLGREEKLPSFEWFASYELYESAYIALFDVGLPEPPVPLFESAHNKSQPAQDIALENTYFYEVMGLKSDPTRGVPDYLVTQLEFLAALRYTREHTTDEGNAVSLARAEKDFLERHLLNWVPSANTKLERIMAPGYSVLMAMLLQFLEEMRNTL